MTEQTLFLAPLVPFFLVSNVLFLLTLEPEAVEAVARLLLLPPATMNNSLFHLVYWEREGKSAYREMKTRFRLWWLQDRIHLLMRDFIARLFTLKSVATFCRVPVFNLLWLSKEDLNSFKYLDETVLAFNVRLLLQLISIQVSLYTDCIPRECQSWPLKGRYTWSQKAISLNAFKLSRISTLVFFHIKEEEQTLEILKSERFSAWFQEMEKNVACLLFMGR